MGFFLNRGETETTEKNLCNLRNLWIKIVELLIIKPLAKGFG